jgi:DNA-binding NarL/FixJ family response regulator
MIEEWKRIPNTEYKVSSMGNVYSEKLGRELMQWHNDHGYKIVHLYIDGEKFLERVHRLVATAFLEQSPGACTVNHKNGVKDDNRLENLEWLSHEDNMKHASLHGLIKKGSEAAIAKLDEASVELIKLMFIEGLSNQEIANKYGVARGTISKIRQLKTWVAVRPDLADKLEKTGAKHGRLNGADIPEIRRLLAIGISQSEIATKYNVSRTTISDVSVGKSWVNY